MLLTQINLPALIRSAKVYNVTPQLVAYYRPTLKSEDSNIVGYRIRNLCRVFWISI